MTRRTTLLICVFYGNYITLLCLSRPVTLISCAPLFYRLWWRAIRHSFQPSQITNPILNSSTSWNFWCALAVVSLLWYNGNAILVIKIIFILISSALCFWNYLGDMGFDHVHACTVWTTFRDVEILAFQTTKKTNKSLLT